MKLSRAERVAADRAMLGNDIVSGALARHHGMSMIEHAFDQIVELEIALGELRTVAAARHARSKRPSAWRDDPELLRQVSPYPLLADENRAEAKALEELRSYERGLLHRNGFDVDRCEPYAEPEIDPAAAAMERRRAFNAAQRAASP
jgi:hypothetical protein